MKNVRRHQTRTAYYLCLGVQVLVLVSLALLSALTNTSPRSAAERASESSTVSPE